MNSKPPELDCLGCVLILALAALLVIRVIVWAI
jgi:hypothetical protein